VREALELVRCDSPEEPFGPNHLFEFPSQSALIVAGSWIGRYKIVRKVGEGGLGTVYEAVREHDGVRMPAAIKVLRSDLPAEEFSGFLRREAQLLAGLEHPNICRLFDWGRTEVGEFYLVMELIAGESLRERTAHLGYTMRERLASFCSLCKAVSHAHRNGILHLDIKPSNIRFDGDGNIKLLDFSISERSATLSHSASVDAARWYSRGYTAPERIAGDSPTIACDVYALGVVLRDMLGLESQAGNARCCSYGNGIPRPSSHTYSSPEVRAWTKLRTIVETATALLPARRYRSVDELRAQIEKVLDNDPQSERIKEHFCSHIQEGRSALHRAFKYGP
jgi:serine/threonine-protein kinase